MFRNICITVGVIIAIFMAYTAVQLKACDEEGCWVSAAPEDGGGHICWQYGNTTTARVAYNENMEMYRLLKKRGFKWLPYYIGAEGYLRQAQAIKRCCLDKPVPPVDEDFRQQFTWVEQKISSRVDELVSHQTLNLAVARLWRFESFPWNQCSAVSQAVGQGTANPQWRVRLSYGTPKFERSFRWENRGQKQGT